MYMTTILTTLRSAPSNVCLISPREQALCDSETVDGETPGRSVATAKDASLGSEYSATWACLQTGEVPLHPQDHILFLRKMVIHHQICLFFSINFSEAILAKKNAPILSHYSAWLRTGFPLHGLWLSPTNPGSMIPCTKQSMFFFSAHIVPQQHKLIGSSAQHSSGVHWCRSRVRFNEVPKKALVQSQVTFNRVPERFRRRSGRLWCWARSGSTVFRKRFRRRF